MAITSSNLATAIAKLTAVETLPLLMEQVVVGNLVFLDFEPIVAQQGDSVSNPYREGVVLNRHIEASFRVPDVTKVIAVPDLLRLYMQPAMTALAEALESDLLKLHSRFLVVGVGGTPLTETVVDEAGTQLFNAGVAASSPKYLVVDSAAYSHLRQIPHFSEYNSAGDAGLRALVDGPIGKLKNFFVMRSRFVEKTGGDPVTTSNLAFSREAICLSLRRLPRPLPGAGTVAEYAELGNFGLRVLMDYKPNSLTQDFTVDMLYGCDLMRPDHGVTVRS